MKKLLAAMALFIPTSAVAAGLDYIDASTPTVGNTNYVIAYINSWLGYGSTLPIGRIPVIPYTKGGTGLTTIGSAGQALIVDVGGTSLTYGTISSGGASGSTGQVQYNLGSAFAGTPNITIGTTGVTLGTSTFTSTITTPLGTAGLATIGTTGVLSSEAYATTAQGGTGLTTIGLAGQYLGVNSGATALTYITPPVYYGGLYYDNAATPLDITTTTAGTYYTVASNGTQNLVAGSVSGTTVNVASGHGDITIGTGSGGEYNVSYNITYDSSVNNQTNTGYVFIGTSSQSACTSQTLAVQSGTTFTSGTRCQLHLSDGDVVTLRVTSDASGGVAHVKKVNLSLNRIGS